MRKLNELLTTQQQTNLSEVIEKLIVSPVVGKLQRTRPFNDEPKFVQYFCLNEGRTEEDSGSGIYFYDELAKLKALAETVERYALGNKQSSLMFRSYSELSSQAVDPSLWVNYTKIEDAQFLEKVRNTPTNWNCAKNLISQQDVLVPAQLVYVPYYFETGELQLRDPVSTGAAFGISSEDALKRGMIECIERDAFMIRYFKRDRVPKVTHPVLEELFPYFARYQLELNIFDLTTDLKIPVMLATIKDKTGIGPAIAAGLKADESQLNAALGAMLEAQHVRSWLRFSYHAEGKPQIKEPFQIKDLKTRGYYWFSTDMLDCLDFFLASNDVKKICEDATKYSLDDILAIFETKGYSVFAVDITPDTPIGKVTKVLIPELQPLRLVESPEVYVTKRLYERGLDKLNLVPHPFT